jgi:uncharacterized protein (DUF302 family)
MTLRIRLTQRIFLAAFLVAAFMLAGNLEAAQPTGPGVQVRVKGSIEEALGQLKKMVADNGMMIMGELHQGKVLAMTGLKVYSETVFVGNPTVGKKLFSAEPGSGLVVPVRVNLYVDTRGDTVMSYIPPTEQLAGFHNPKVDMVAKMLDEKLQSMAKMLAK